MSTSQLSEQLSLLGINIEKPVHHPEMGEFECQQIFSAKTAIQETGLDFFLEIFSSQEYGSEIRFLVNRSSDNSNNPAAQLFNYNPESLMHFIRQQKRVGGYGYQRISFESSGAAHINATTATKHARYWAFTAPKAKTAKQIAELLDNFINALESAGFSNISNAIETLVYTQPVEA